MGHFFDRKAILVFILWAHEVVLVIYKDVSMSSSVMLQRGIISY